MSINREFCDYNFLGLFLFKPSRFYFAFFSDERTKLIIDLMGYHPDFHLVFKYNEEKRIRATFIVFDGELESGDIKCICVLFNGYNDENYCYFYKVGEDSKIGCIGVGYQNHRMLDVVTPNAGTDIDVYFDVLCERISRRKKPADETVTMFLYDKSDNYLSLLDMKMERFPRYFLGTLGSYPVIETKMYNKINYLIYKSQKNKSFLITRTNDGKNPIDIKLSDSEVIKEIAKAIVI